jgi:hypothetical protein
VKTPLYYAWGSSGARQQNPSRYLKLFPPFLFGHHHAVCCLQKRKGNKGAVFKKEKGINGGAPNKYTLVQIF